MADELSLDLFDSESDRGADEAFEDEPVLEERPEGAPPPEPRVWSVSKVNRSVRTMLEGQVDALWVGGEIANWTRSRPGHCYFTLKDEEAQLRGVMFAREARQLPVDPEQGMTVRVFGALTLYEKRGDFQMVVRRLEGEGAEGLWRRAFEKLRATLEADGLLAEDRKRPLPKYPACIGVVTSPTGAAFHDIVSVLRRRAPWVRVVLAGSRVQGEGAALEIAEAIEHLAASERPDVMIVGRGGGSIEDLWAFNEEPVVRAIAACPIPVVSAVGHEVDVTLSDLVADVRAPTPSAAAETVVPDREALQEALRGVPARLERGVRAASQRRRLAVEGAMSALARSLEARLGPLRQALDMSAERLERRARSIGDRDRARLVAASGRLEALSPLATLARGYSVARSPEGRVLSSVQDFSPGKVFDLRVRDGTVRATVQDRGEEL